MTERLSLRELQVRVHTLHGLAAQLAVENEKGEGSLRTRQPTSGDYNGWLARARNRRSVHEQV